MALITEIYTPSLDSPGMTRVVKIPEAVYSAIADGSSASAPECFVNQRFCNRLQAFMVGYAQDVLAKEGIYVS